MSRALAIKDGKLTYEKPKHKYGAKPTNVCLQCARAYEPQNTPVKCSCGYKLFQRFASKREAARYVELWTLEGREITGLKLQPKFKFPPGFSYVGDFEYIENGKRVVEDTKGVQTDVFRLKRKCMAYYYPDIELRITK